MPDAPTQTNLRQPKQGKGGRHKPDGAATVHALHRALGASGVCTVALHRLNLLHHHDVALREPDDRPVIVCLAADDQGEGLGLRVACTLTSDCALEHDLVPPSNLRFRGRHSRYKETVSQPRTKRGGPTSTPQGQRLEANTMRELMSTHTPGSCLTKKSTVGRSIDAKLGASVGPSSTSKGSHVNFLPATAGSTS